MEQWVPILLVVIFSTALSVGLVLASHFIGIRRPSHEKSRPYECGIPSVGTANERHPVRFYLVAMLFILFDVEIIFLYPWATVYRSLSVFGFVEMAIFLLVLILGYIYAWKKGALEWQ